MWGVGGEVSKETDQVLCWLGVFQINSLTPRTVTCNDHFFT